MSQYPHDEFDDVPPYQSGEAGKHRAPASAGTGSGGRGGLKWIALLAVVALAVGAFSWLVLPNLRDSEPEAADGTEEAAEEQAEGDEDAGDPEGEGDAGDEGGEGEDSEEDEADEDEDTQEEVAADPSAPVQVFNYQGPAGQEQTLQEELQGMGYNVTHVDAWAWSEIETPVIYYPAGAEEHAQDLGQNLGIDNLVEDGANWNNVAVVVGPEYSE